MKIFLMKHISIAMALLAVSSTGFADRELEARIENLETEMHQIRTETALGNYGPNRVPVREDTNTNRWFFSVSPLYWHAKVGKTEFAYSRAIKHGPENRELKEINFSWNWGCRVGVGYHLPHDGWNLEGEYTWIRSSGNEECNAGMHNMVMPVKAIQSVVRYNNKTINDRFIFCLNATSDFSLFYRAIHLQIGRDYFTTPTLSVRPHFGMQGTCIDQKQITRYSGGKNTKMKMQDATGKEVVFEMLGPGPNTVTVKDLAYFRGLGPLIGLSSKWDLGSGFGIFGGLRGAILLGSFDLKCDQWYSLKEKDPIRFTNKNWGVCPNTQIQMGLRYDRYFRSGIHHVGLSLGFEQEYFWNQKQALKLCYSNSTINAQKILADMAYYGLMAKLQIDF